MFVVVALGGNALLRRGEAMTAEAQRRNIALAAAAIADIAKFHRLVVTHGNGPQVGLLAEQMAEPDGKPRFALDIVGAESQGMIGYVIEQELSLRLPACEIATLLTQVVVDPDDPAFGKPDKPIGPEYDEITMKRLTASYGWTFVLERTGYRRVVPSPVPGIFVKSTRSASCSVPASS